jgi:predicted HAD superfamily Cof-like phosphohydrolase
MTGSPAPMVAYFHEWAFGEKFGEGKNDPAQRVKLHNTEHAECIEALEDEDYRLNDYVEYLTRAAHELADNVWVCYGSAHSLGIPLDRVLVLLYQSLLTRVNNDGSPAVDANNKVIKTENYRSPLPAIRELIRQTLAERNIPA